MLKSVRWFLRLSCKKPNNSWNSNTLKSCRITYWRWTVICTRPSSNKSWLLKLCNNKKWPKSSFPCRTIWGKTSRDKRRNSLGNSRKRRRTKTSKSPVSSNHSSLGLKLYSKKLRNCENQLCSTLLLNSKRSLWSKTCSKRRRTFKKNNKAV